MTYLLDSSAWLTHLFSEPGVEEVNQVFDELRADISISALSIPEVFGRLTALGQQGRWPDVWEAYDALFTKVISVDEEIAHRALVMRSAATSRLPTIDGLIAATASVQGLTLVHRDPHFSLIPAQLLQQLLLPDK